MQDPEKYADLSGKKRVKTLLRETDPNYWFLDNFKPTFLFWIPGSTQGWHKKKPAQKTLYFCISYKSFYLF